MATWTPTLAETCRRKKILSTALERGMKHVEMAELIGCSPTSIMRWSRGEQDLPGGDAAWEKLEKYLEALYYRGVEVNRKAAIVPDATSSQTTIGDKARAARPEIFAAIWRTANSDPSSRIRWEAWRLLAAYADGKPTTLDRDDIPASPVNAEKMIEKIRFQICGPAPAGAPDDLIGGKAEHKVEHEAEPLQ